MNVPKVFLGNWREGYRKLIDDAHEAIVAEMYKDFPPYVPDAHPSEKTLLRRFTRRFKSSEGSWDDFWAKIDLDDAHSMHAVTDLSDKLVNMHPEFAAKHRGLKYLLMDLAMMRMTAEKCTDKWLMRVLKDFREIYRDNPGLCDYDALAAFVKLEELTKKPEQLRALDEVPRDICEGLDLGFDRNLKKYIDRYVMFIEDGGAPAPERDSAAISLTYGDYGDRVAVGEDGVYRWSYDRKARGKPLPKKIFLRCFILPALLFLILLVLPFAVLGPLLGLAGEMGAGAFVRTLFLSRCSLPPSAWASPR